MGYGVTEAGGMISMLPRATSNSSIGRPLPDVQMKLSKGTAGETLIKGLRTMKASVNLSLSLRPSILLWVLIALLSAIRYLNNEAATQAAFNKDGFYRTGNLAHMEGNEFIFDGRASSDSLKVEAALMALPYVVEVVVVAVPDPSCANQIAVVIRPRVAAVANVSLNGVRSDLAHSLPVYTLPTKLRVLGEEETLPRSVSEKINKKETLRRYFEGNSAKVEACAPPQIKKDKPQKAWDWAGLQ
ncbi:hypothetical protein BDV36DRAFT_294699 [Aspergillus pseudocaelatus]|uniref:AMP-binding enzyme C-terminal domain-containing protein n=1 Tax=Aspergillus pseudocaelatus TaxID=1825620 RepID=A0ABQ6WP08_9EURO|nr:hypothetical protein BDV36DRAFT_294699 [Aspergillus pseudocaelatus]